jgi:hypothetical protein
VEISSGCDCIKPSIVSHSRSAGRLARPRVSGA